MRGLAAARLTIPFEPWKPDEGANLTPEDSTSRRARRPSPGTRLLPCTPWDRLTLYEIQGPRRGNGARRAGPGASRDRRRPLRVPRPAEQLDGARLRPLLAALLREADRVA